MLGDINTLITDIVLSCTPEDGRVLGARLIHHMKIDITNRPVTM